MFSPWRWPEMPEPCRRPPGTCQRLAERRKGGKDMRDAARNEALALKPLVRWEMGKVRYHKEGHPVLSLLYGLLARWRQDAQCAPGKHQEDGCRGGQAEGQGEEGRSFRTRSNAVMLQRNKFLLIYHEDLVRHDYGY